MLNAFIEEWRMSKLAVLAILLFVPADDFLGRWDLTIVSPDGQSYPSWLEVTREAGTLKARVVGRGGSVFPVPDVAIEDGGLRFQYSRGQSGAATVYKAQLKGGRLEGTMVVGTGPTSTWTGVRAPKWPEKVKAKKLGTPELLFNGKDLS